MTRQLELIAIEQTVPADGQGQLVTLSITGTPASVSEAAFVDLLIAIHGGSAGMIDARHLFGEHVRTVRGPHPVDAEVGRLLGNTTPLVTLEADVFLGAGRLIDFWLPYSLVQPQRQRAEETAAWNRLVMDSVWVWLGAKLAQVDITTKALYVGDNVFTAMTQRVDAEKPE